LNQLKIILFLVSFIFIQFSRSQEIRTEAVKEYPLDADRFIGADVLDNIYFVKNNTLFKKSYQGMLLYNNVNYGKLSSVTVQDPFKLILFYRDFNSVILLDNRLNEITRTLTFPDVNLSLVGFAPDNNLWVYSKDDNILQLYDYQNKNIRLSSQPLSSYKKNFQAENLISNNENVWIWNKNGVIQFNQYLNYIGAISAKNIKNIFLYKKGIIVRDDSGIFYLKEGIKTPIDLKIDDPDADLYFIKDTFYVFACHILYQYQIM